MATDNKNALAKRLNALHKLLKMQNERVTQLLADRTNTAENASLQEVRTVLKSLSDLYMEVYADWEKGSFDKGTQGMDLAVTFYRGVLNVLGDDAARDAAQEEKLGIPSAEAPGSSFLDGLAEEIAEARSRPVPSPPKVEGTPPTPETPTSKLVERVASLEAKMTQVDQIQRRLTALDLLPREYVRVLMQFEPAVLAEILEFCLDAATTRERLRRVIPARRIPTTAVTPASTS